MEKITQNQSKDYILNSENQNPWHSDQVQLKDTYPSLLLLKITLEGTSWWSSGERTLTCQFQSPGLGRFHMTQNN